MAHFYLNPELADASTGSIVTIIGTEARHAVTVGRLRAGESLSVGNGAGLVATGTVRVAERDQVDVEVRSVSFEPAPRPAIWLAQALAKGDRDELAIQAATELGVDGVIPWAAARSIVRWEGAKVQKHEARWASILREASKQSLRGHIPELLPLASTASLALLAAELRIVILEPTAVEALGTLKPDGRDLLLVVGPEGGIAPAELTRLTAAGASAFSLGSTVLRTSTAGPAAIAVLNVALGRW